MVLFPCFREFSGAVEFIVFCFFKSGSAMILVLFFKLEFVGSFMNYASNYNQR
jgi:hypothetical protein